MRVLCEPNMLTAASLERARVWQDSWLDGGPGPPESCTPGNKPKPTPIPGRRPATTARARQGSAAAAKAPDDLVQRGLPGGAARVCPRAGRPSPGQRSPGQRSPGRPEDVADGEQPEVQPVGDQPPQAARRPDGD